MFLDTKLAVSVDEAAKMLGVSKPSLYKLIHREDFHVFKIGGRTMIHKVKLEQWADAQIVTENRLKKEGAQYVENEND